MQSNLSAGYLLCLDQELDDLPFELAAGWFAADICEVKRHARTGLQQPTAAKVAVRPLSGDEQTALPILARGASLRFTLTRAYDWLNTPAGALVTRKDPLAFARRLEFYADRANAGVFA